METQRLKLRRLTEADAAFILQLLNQPSWIEFIGDRDVRSCEQACDYLTRRVDSQFEQYGYGMWGIELSQEPCLIGMGSGWRVSSRLRLRLPPYCVIRGICGTSVAVPVVSDPTGG